MEIGAASEGPVAVVVTVESVVPSNRASSGSVDCAVYRLELDAAVPLFPSEADGVSKACDVT